MIIQTDVKCLYCGHVSWRVEMEHGAAWRTAEMVWPEPGGTLPARPRCTRCDGPVYLDGDYQQVRLRQSERRARLQSLKAGAHVPSSSPSELEPQAA
jgi:hypothetical protein